MVSNLIKPPFDGRSTRLLERSIHLNSWDSRLMIKGWVSNLVFICSFLVMIFSLVILASTVRSVLSERRVFAVKLGTDVFEARIISYKKGST